VNIVQTKCLCCDRKIEVHNKPDKELDATTAETFHSRAFERRVPSAAAPEELSLDNKSKWMEEALRKVARHHWLYAKTTGKEWFDEEKDVCRTNAILKTKENSKHRKAQSKESPDNSVRRP
jgi:hypothetical protein